MCVSVCVSGTPRYWSKSILYDHQSDLRVPYYHNVMKVHTIHLIVYICRYTLIHSWCVCVHACSEGTAILYGV